MPSVPGRNNDFIIYLKFSHVFILLVAEKPPHGMQAPVKSIVYNIVVDDDQVMHGIDLVWYSGFSTRQVNFRTRT